MPTKAQLAEQETAIEQLREWIRPGDTVRTILRHVSSSGMTRDISVVAMVDGEPFDITYWVGRALGDRIVNSGVRVGGCGMDMGFALVYNLSMTLWRDYQCLGEGEMIGTSAHIHRCPSPEHVNPPRPAQDGVMSHHDGYAISQRWL